MDIIGKCYISHCSWASVIFHIDIVGKCYIPHRRWQVLYFTSTSWATAIFRGQVLYFTLTLWVNAIFHTTSWTSDIFYIEPISNCYISHWDHGQVVYLSLSSWVSAIFLIISWGSAIFHMESWENAVLRITICASSILCISTWIRATIHIESWTSAIFHSYIMAGVKFHIQSCASAIFHIDIIVKYFISHWHEGQVLYLTWTSQKELYFTLTPLGSNVFHIVHGQVQYFILISWVSVIDIIGKCYISLWHHAEVLYFPLGNKASAICTWTSRASGIFYSAF